MDANYVAMYSVYTVMYCGMHMLSSVYMLMYLYVYANMPHEMLMLKECIN